MPDPRDTMPDGRWHAASGVLPQCACNEYWPGEGHPPDCPVGGLLRTQEERIQNLRAAMEEALSRADSVRMLGAFAAADMCNVLRKALAEDEEVE